MLSVVRIKGGLGNQMFQYAFFISLKKKHPFSFYLFDLTESLYCHSGYQFDYIFHTKTFFYWKVYRRIKKYCPCFFYHTQNISQENSLQFSDQYFKPSGAINIFDGYWQSEKYFTDSSKKIRSLYHFNEELLNDSSRQLKNSMNECAYVSVHIRRGDYLSLSDHLGICNISYYQKAISYIKTTVKNPIFVFFSDDIPWVKEHFQEKSAIYVDWNQGKDSWQDMYLMSRCKHNIVANSSFSWWGAWLNNNPLKIVVAPKQWFKYSPNYDIIPDGWITIDA